MSRLDTEMTNRTGLPHACYERLQAQFDNVGVRLHSNKAGSVCHIIGARYLCQMRDEQAFVMRITDRIAVPQFYENHEWRRMPHTGHRNRYITSERRYAVCVWNGHANTLDIKWADGVADARATAYQIGRAWNHEWDVHLYGHDNPGNR